MISAVSTQARRIYIFQLNGENRHSMESFPRFRHNSSGLGYLFNVMSHTAALKRILEFSAYYLSNSSHDILR